MKATFIRLIERHRGLLLTVVGLPLSYFFDVFLQARFWLYKLFLSSSKLHNERVQNIQTQVKLWNIDCKNSKTAKTMCSARPNWLSLSTRFFDKKACHQISLPLYDILQLDTVKMTVTCEPMVTVGMVTKYLIPKGFTLAITLEIADATVGGLAMGVGMTTHSHVVGLYQEAVVCYEVVLGDGSVVKATKDNEFHDLFHSLPWSHGTLGFLVGLELKIIPVKPFVHLKYIPLNNGAQEFQDIIMRYSGAQDKDFKPPHFLEMTVFSMKEAVLITGDFADVPVNQSHKINQMTKWWKPYFYKHVENKLTACSEVLDEYVPIRQYLLRHDKSIFWVLREMIPFSENPLFIFLLGWALPPKPAFMKFTTTPVIRALTFTKQVFQDIVLPLNCLKEQLETAKDLFDIWPILVYPCKIFDHGKESGLLRNPPKGVQCDGTDWGMFNDLGVYGVPKLVKEKKPFDAVAAMRKMETFTRSKGGYPFLYADTFMTREEFEEMFDLRSYEEVRKKYGANGAFPHLFDKVKPEIDVVAVGKDFIDPL